jgi:uncharacterized protein YndB with AHSA1/START domain
LGLRERSLIVGYVDIEESVHIDAPPSRVWELVSDIRRHPEFAGPKSITKVIDFDGPLEVGQRWTSHEKFGPQKFDAPSEITGVVPERELSWVSFPPMKDENRGEGGRVLWAYKLEPDGDGTRLTHTMEVLLPAKGAGMLKAMYAVFSLPRKQREGTLTSLNNIKAAAESSG